MGRLGIYFGPQGISIVETKLKQPLNNIHIPKSAISPAELSEEKVPEEIKIATLVKNALIREGVESKEATLILSGKDLIIRTFEMPILPQEELLTAVNFEAKKYIPFKIEELFSDCQWKLDKPARKNFVLFAGIKKETLDKYLSILDELGLKAKSIEYSAFSILRIAKLAGVKEKGVIAIIDIDLAKNDEANFVVLENGFPLFSRDLTPIGETKEGIASTEEEGLNFKETKSSAFFEKLRAEILVSLNYYERKFVGKSIKKIFFIINPVYNQDLLESFKDIGVGIQFIDVNKYVGPTTEFSLAFIKAFSGSLSEVRTELKINLLLAKERDARQISASLPALSLSLLLRAHLKVVLACLLIGVIAFFFGKYRMSPLEKELTNTIALRPKVSTVNPETGYEELNSLSSQYSAKINILKNLIKKRLHFTSLFNLMPRLVPDNMWLSNLTLKNTIEEDKIELTLEGLVYLNDSNKEIELVNDFISYLNRESFFQMNFKDINIVSLDRKDRGGKYMTDFVIVCRNYKL